MGMKTHPQYFLSKPRRSSKAGMTIGIDLGDIWSHYSTLNLGQYRKLLHEKPSSVLA
jgi:hypothetical protein